MTNNRLKRKGFVVVKDVARCSEPAKVFCGHCGRQPDAGHVDELSRVCPSCGMGLLLHAAAALAPASTDPFLVVDSSLAVCALSRRGERLLGVSETETVNRHILDVLVPADAESGDDGLATALVWAARGETATRNVVVRPKNAFGVRYWARIGQCGPIPAALVVLADAG
jgi:PAS domain-containing protein